MTYTLMRGYGSAQRAAWETVLRDIQGTGRRQQAGLLARLEQLLAIGDTAATAAQLALIPPRRDTTDPAPGVTVKDDMSMDYLIDTHKDFYRIYLHYKEHTLSAADSANIPYIANLCPLEHGPVVYKLSIIHSNVQ